MELKIRDLGKGFDPSKAAYSQNDGVGLQSMRERAELSGGKLSIESTGKGTTVHASWPL